MPAKRISVNKVPATLSEADRDRLSARSYEESWTAIPHRCLSESVRQSVETIYKAITGTEITDLPEYVDCTWSVAAKDGALNRIYGPTVYTNEAGDGLVLKWGDKVIPIELSESRIEFPTAVSKVDANFTTAEANGWDTAAIQLKVTDKETKTTHLLPVTLRAASFDDRPDAESLEIMLESEPSQILNFIGKEPQRVKTGAQLEGKVIRLGECPVGTYTITKARKTRSDRVPFLAQTVAPAAFTATYSERIEDDNGDVTWVSHDIELDEGDEFVFRPNEALNDELEKRYSESDEGEAVFDLPFEFELDESMRYVKLNGPTIKLAHMPLGKYAITAYKTINSVYTPYLLQTTAVEDFSATTRSKDEKTGEWVDVPVSVAAGDAVVIKPNGKLKTAMSATPVFTSDAPGYVEILEKGEWNGYPTAKIKTDFTTFRQTKGDFSLNF